MSYSTDRRRVAGSGSAHHGAGHWLKERASAVLLIPLTVWGLWAAWSIAGGGIEGAIHWLKSPLNAMPLTALILVGLYHMQLGLRVVIEDYVHKPLGKGLLLLVNLAVCLALGLGSVFAILKIAFNFALPGVGA